MWLGVSHLPPPPRTSALNWKATPFLHPTPSGTDSFRPTSEPAWALVWRLFTCDWAEARGGHAKRLQFYARHEVLATRSSLVFYTTVLSALFVAFRSLLYSVADVHTSGFFRVARVHLAVPSCRANARYARMISLLEWHTDWKQQ